MALPLLALAPIATTLFGIGKGLLQGRKASVLERQNIRPTATVNSNIVRNVGDASIAAQTGLTDRVYNNALGQLNTGLNAGARQIGRMGGTASVASTLQAYNQGINNLAAQDQQAQIQNQNRLYGARNTLANEQQRVWNWNEGGRYNEMAQRIAQLRGVSQQNVFNGLTTLATQAENLDGLGSSSSSIGNFDLAKANLTAQIQGNNFSNTNRKLFGTGYKIQNRLQPTNYYQQSLGSSALLPE